MQICTILYLFNTNKLLSKKIFLREIGKTTYDNYLQITG